MTVQHRDIDGVRLAVDRVGRGRPVVCLSSICHDAHDFDALADRLGDRFKFIRIEWPGHGRSGPDTRPASAERYAELVAATLDELGVERPLVIGNSIGGATAIQVATARPVAGWCFRQRRPRASGCDGSAHPQHHGGLFRGRRGSRVVVWHRLRALLPRGPAETRRARPTGAHHCRRL
jgi:pimeloyl-ACP methyl ester carboxylesterase